MKIEWKIIFLIYADFFEPDTEKIRAEAKIQRELRALFSDIKNTPINEGCEIYTVVNSIRYKNKEKSNQTFIYKSEKNQAGTPNEFSKIETHSLDNSLQRKESLTSILKIIDDLGPSDKVFLITWDHGSVFGINKEEKTPNFVTSNFETDIEDVLNWKDETKQPELSINSYNLNGKIFSVQKIEKIKEFTRFIDNEAFYDFTIKDNIGAFSLSKKNEFEVSTNATIENNEFSLGNEINSEKIKNFTVTNDNIINLKPFLNKNKFKIITENEIIIEHSVEIFTTLKSKFSITNIGNVLADPELNFSIDLNYELEMLTNAELADAIKTGFNNKKADILLMMNCNMMNVHTIASLSGAVDILVAPESGIDEPGYNYCAILEEIKAGTKATDIAALCIDSFNAASRCNQTSCISHRNEYMKCNDTISLFAIDLTKDSKPLIDSINKFGSDLQKKFNHENPKFIYLKAVLLQTIESDCKLQSNEGKGYYLYDLDEFIKKFNIKNIQSFKNIIDIELDELKKIIIVQKKKLTIKEIQKNSGEFSSFAIFFPFNQVDTKTAVGPFIQKENDPNKKDPFSDWFSFLDHFFS